jgi:membrane-bound serine protease (ClpP class)
VYPQSVGVLNDPDVVFVLVMLGLLGVAFEAYNPGGVVPGVLGALALIAAFPGLMGLPVSWLGVVLLGIGVALFIVEALVGGYGVAAIAGIIAFIAGGLTLFDSPYPSERATPFVVVISAVAVGGAFWAIARRARAARSRRVATGAGAMVGEVATARDDVSPLGGHVSVHGEIWAARTTHGTVARGRTARVIEVHTDDLTLVIESGGIP